MIKASMCTGTMEKTGSEGCTTKKARMISQRRWLLLALLSIALLHHVSASSRSSSRRSDLTPRRKKKKRRHTVPDPHDVSSSSPSFVPLVFTEDEREEDILSALARLEMEGDDENEAKVEKQNPTVKKSKRVAKKALSTSKVEVKESVDHKTDEQRDKELETKVAPANEEPVKAEAEKTGATSPRDMTTATTNGQHSLTALEIMRHSPPRKQTGTLPDYPPRPQWKRPEQQSLQKLPPTTPPVPSSTRAMAGSGVRNPTPTYPYTPVVPPQPKQARTSQEDEISSSTTRWVRKFLAARPKDTLLPVPREYLSDGFNLVQLAPIVEKIGRMEGGYVSPALQGSDTTFPLFKAALRLILSNGEEPTPLCVQRAAEVLYTLVHARFVISPRGLDTVRRVLRRSDGTVDPVFGRCPRIRCRGMPLLPCGDSDSFDPRISVSTRAKRYCPCCGEKFYVWDSKADESAWGPSFSHLFLMIYGSTVFPEMNKKNRAVRNSTEVQPSIFGFKLHPASQLRYSIGD